MTTPPEVWAAFVAERREAERDPYRYTMEHLDPLMAWFEARVDYRHPRTWGVDL